MEKEAGGERRWREVRGKEKERGRIGEKEGRGNKGKGNRKRGKERKGVRRVRIGCS